MKQKSGPGKAPAEQVIKDIRRQTRRHYSAEEKIRIVLEGLRGEENISEPCRREGIAASMYYGWSKEFLEAAKRRLAGDTARAATSGEVKDLRRETAALKEVLADLTLENRLLKKSMHGDGGTRHEVSDVVLGGKRLALIWNTKTGKIARRLPHPNAAEILSVDFSQNGFRLATTSLELAFIARVWDVASGRLVQGFRGHTFDVKSARLSSDAERLVTASSDRTVRVWDVATGQTMLRLQIGEEPKDAFFTRNGRDVIVTTANGEILTYDVSWTETLGKELVGRVCREELPLRSIPCFRNGPFSLRYWREIF